MKKQNNDIKINIVNESVNELPTYAHPTDAGMDLRADFRNPDSIVAHNCDWDSERETFVMFSGGRAAIPTGLKFKLPERYELQIRGRSGLAIKSGIMAHVGTLDANYIGECCVILYNFSDEPFEIKQGDRIGQAILNKVEHIDWNLVDKLEETDRGENGFGSTGK